MKALPFDIRAEVLAAYLQEASKEKNVVISPDPKYSQGFREEVSGIEVNEEMVRILTRRKGMYGHLPESLLIDMPTEGEDEEKAEKIAKQIESVKQFFRPFDESLYEPRIVMELKERLAPDELLKQVIDLPALQHRRSILKDYQFRMVRALAPMLRRIVGNLELTGKCMSAILEHEVTLQLCAGRSVDQMAETLPLGEARLGVNTLVGGRCSNHNYGILVTLGPLTAAQLEPYLPVEARTLTEDQQEQRKPDGINVLDFLCDLFLPLGHELVYEFVPAGEPETRLEDTNGFSNIMGFTTFI